MNSRTVPIYVADNSLSSQDTFGYLCRSSGLVLLLSCTAVVVLGLLCAGRAGPPRWPGFVIHSLHRNLSLISVTLLIVHLLAPVIGGYLGLKLAYAFVPVLPAHIRIWTRLAATASDLIFVVTIVSAARVRAGYRFWRATHLTTYLAWVLGLVHGTGIGTDRDSILWCDVLSVAAVALAAWYRVRAARRLAGQRPL